MFIVYAFAQVVEFCMAKLHFIGCISV